MSGLLTAWKKGALHTHTLWSDGRSLPEVVIQTYRDLGYDFVCLSDHNVFQDDPQVWLPVVPEEGGWPPAFSGAEYDRSRDMLPGKFDEKNVAFKTFVRLKTFKELKEEFEQPGEFLLVGGEEITVIGQPAPEGGRRDYHLNVFNLEETFPPLAGRSGAETIRLNYEQYRAASDRAGRPSFLMLNHPYWRLWDVDPRDLIANPGVRHFEICNNGSAERIPDGLYSPEQFWDIVLAHRIEDGNGMLYGAAGDDAHFYDPARIHDAAGCNLGWVMVHCPDEFTPDNVAAALDRGDYYPTCGVRLDRIEFDPATATLRVKAHAEEGVSYRIEFIATKRGFDRTVTEKDYPGETAAFFRRLATFSPEIGRTVQVSEGPEAVYTMAPDDLYVRAIVISDQPTVMKVPFYPETERAWTQPYAAPTVRQ